MMGDDEDDDKPQVKADEEKGDGIRMGRLGKKKKRTAAPGGPTAKEENQAYTQKLGTMAKAAEEISNRIGSEGFKEEDIEFMRKAIQVLCQSTNPLGKSIDFVTDDVESMSNEFKLWRQEAINCSSKLEEAQKITEELVQPLQDQLAELEEKIREQQAKINSVKSQILLNESTIASRLYSVI